MKKLMQTQKSTTYKIAASGVILKRKAGYEIVPVKQERTCSIWR